MSKIAGLLESLDFSVLVPELNTVLGWVRFLSILAVMIGPVIMLVLGLLYWFKPAEEANYKFGFRTYFGMGSVQAWRFTQKVAGMVYTVLGGILSIVMLIICLKFGGKELLQIVTSAVKCLLWEAGLIFAAWLGITLLVTVLFDERGRFRK